MGEGAGVQEDSPCPSSKGNPTPDEADHSTPDEAGYSIPEVSSWLFNSSQTINLQLLDVAAKEKNRDKKR